MDTNKIRVLIVSQQVLFRQGLEIVFSAMKDTEISGTTDFSNGIAFALDESPPDVAIIDIDGPSDSSLILARRMKQRLPSIGVVMLTSKPNDAQLFQALKAQAAAYLSKEITADHLANVIRRVARGEHPINESLTTQPNVADQVLKQFQELSSQSESEDLFRHLPREKQKSLIILPRVILTSRLRLYLALASKP